MKHIDLEQLRVDADTMNRAQMAEKHGVCVATISAQIGKLGIHLPHGIRPAGSGASQSPEVQRALKEIRTTGRPLRGAAGKAPNGRVSIVVTEAVLDQFWKSLPLATKADLLTGLEEIVS